MTPNPTSYFLSTLTASREERRVAGGVLFLSLVVFVALAPFAKEQLPAISAFIPAYQSSLVVIDLITAALLFSQFFSYRSRALYVLGCGYLFTATITVAHTLTFPGLYAPGGLLGAGPQTTAWLYMFWHGGFPLFVTGYAAVKGRDGPLPFFGDRPMLAFVLGYAAIFAVVAGLTLLVTAGQDLLPSIMQGNRYTPSMIVVVSTVWLICAGALATLWLRKPHSVLDLWLMVVICAWLVDIALSAVLNQGRFDLGFYAGRAYGLLAASFVLLVLLVESGMLHRQLVQLTATLQRLTMLDALTGIANRRAFDGALEAEWCHALRSGLPLSLMMIDIDYFKVYNDSHGHVEGDRCLQAVAASLRGGVQRANDLVARYGGEEFAVLLPQTDAAAAGKVGERLRRMVEGLAIQSPESPLGQVSISVGIAEFRLPPGADPLDYGNGGHNALTLVKTADRLLYAAKAAGRNRVVVERWVAEGGAAGELCPQHG